jgi:hypothetical protein
MFVDIKQEKNKRYVSYFLSTFMLLLSMFLMKYENTLDEIKTFFLLLVNIYLKIVLNIIK